MLVSVFDNDEAEGSVFFMSGFQGGVVALGLGLAMMECGLAFLSHHPDHQPTGCTYQQQRGVTNRSAAETQ